LLGLNCALRVLVKAMRRFVEKARERGGGVPPQLLQLGVGSVLIRSAFYALTVEKLDVFTLLSKVFSEASYNRVWVDTFYHGKLSRRTGRDVLRRKRHQDIA
jgi:hypothetical protein